MHVHWAKPDVVSRSKKCSKARLSPRGGLGPHKHTSGSISFEAHREKIRKKTGVRIPIIELLHKTHTKSDGTYVDGRARKINEDFEKKLRQRLADRQGSQDVNESVEFNYTPTNYELDELYLEAVQPSNKGRIYGLPSLNKKQKHTGPSTFRGEEFSSMKAELQATNAELESTKEELTDNNNRLKALESTFDLIKVHLPQVVLDKAGLSGKNDSGNKNVDGNDEENDDNDGEESNSNGEGGHEQDHMEEAN